MLPITDVAKKLGLSPGALLPWGPLAKLTWPTVNTLRAAPPRGRLVLVTAMTPTRYGEGKTTSLVGLAQGLARRGVRVAAALREPSLGPVFGAKGGGTGGGRTSVEPSARINLHCTGDLHAITSANNLLAALVDNALHFRQRRLREVTWRRCLDMNDRFLRDAVIGLGGPANGVPREEGFDITAASQVMATLCLADGVADLKARLGRLLVGVDEDGAPVTAGDLGAVGAMAALLGDALLPNLAQTTEGVPVLLHGGPFGNIAHGCSSVMATRSALGLADVVLTEAGFAFDLGGEKFLDLKCRMAGLWPAAVVLVITARALRFHGGDVPGPGALEAGFGNVRRHLAAIRGFGLSPVVALNVFEGDDEADLALVERLVAAEGVPVARNDGFVRGGEGSVALADVLMANLPAQAPAPAFAYPLEAPFEEKVRAVATKVYGAARVDFTAEARAQLARARAWGYGELPVCIAKTHLSLSDDATKQGAPEGFGITVRQVRISAGAGFLLALTGDILTMPGLPRAPAASRLDLSDDGVVLGVR